MIHNLGITVIVKKCVAVVLSDPHVNLLRSLFHRCPFETQPTWDDQVNNTLSELEQKPVGKLPIFSGTTIYMRGSMLPSTEGPRYDRIMNGGKESFQSTLSRS